MTRVRATFHYAIRRFLVEGDLLGGAFAVRVEGHDVMIIFPLAGAHDEDPATASPGAPFKVRFPDRDEVPLVEGAQDIHVTMSSSSVGEGPTLENVDVLRAEVVIDGATFAVGVDI
jgi:hypothetical protein